MPYDDPDPEDPNMLVGVEIPAGETSDLDMAYTFAEEFVQMGYSAEQLMAVFRNPYYAGAYRAYLQLGEENTRSIVQEVVDVWGGFQIVFIDGEGNYE